MAFLEKFNGRCHVNVDSEFDVGSCRCGNNLRGSELRVLKHGKCRETVYEFKIGPLEHQILLEVLHGQCLEVSSHAILDLPEAGPVNGPNLGSRGIS